jgi:hypothetical protein
LPGERLYVGISSMKERSFSGAKFWALIVDDYSDYCWSFVMKNKSDIKTRIKTLLTDLKIANRIVKFIRCDDAGENITKSSFKSPFEFLYGEKPKLHDNLKMFGEVGVITTKERIQAKLSNRGTTCMFVGYTEHHSRDIYRMLNLTTNSIINPRDIIWLNKTYKEWKENKATIFNVEDDILELPTGVDKVKLIENATKETKDENNKLDKKFFRAMRKLESWFNPEATKVVEDYSHGREITLDHVNLALFYTVTVKERTTYEGAINFEKKEDQIK